MPGGPVSSVAGLIEIFGRKTITNSRKLRGTRSTIAGAGFFGSVAAVARRILQHSVVPGFGCGFAGLEWNGQPPLVSVFFATAALNAQWFEMAIQAQIVIATIRQRAAALTSTQSPTEPSSSNVFFLIHYGRDWPGGHAFRRHDIGRWRTSCRSWRGWRILFDSRRHQHGSEE